MLLIWTLLFINLQKKHSRNKLNSSLFHDNIKTVTYDDGPKMKRDASVKIVFFLPKKTTFTEASLFIFGPWTYIMALA